MNKFLPVNRQDMTDRGWQELDFVLVSGDAYIDHPSFGLAIIARVLENAGYKVGVIAQPDWRNKESIAILGKPKLGFLVSGGNIDSMVNHYSVAKKRRDKDAYTPGGRIGARPDRATSVYGNLIRQKYKDATIILGGIEASLRRLGHYDYWDNKIKRSILLDASADLLVYGMGEKTIVEVADSLNAGIPVSELTYIRGTVFKSKTCEFENALLLPGFHEVKKNKKAYAQSFMTQTRETHFAHGKVLVEAYDENLFVIQNLPAKPLLQLEFDDVYGLPYTRQVHPMYKEPVPAIEEVKFSIISNRGCFGNCNFCALTFHQGRIVQSRSHESILDEARTITSDENFKGYIHDVGGPTANFRAPSCSKQMEHGVCKDKDCLGVSPCERLEVDHKDYMKLLRRMKDLPKIKKVFVRSGIRFDYLMYDEDDSFFKELVKDHISGQLKVAPEHVSRRVLEYMGKPYHQVYTGFVAKYKQLNHKYKLKQFIVPYLMSSHPGSNLDDAVELAEFLRDEKITPQQVQDFYPTPSTISTVMYYTELDPRTMKPVYVAKNPHEKSMQRALIQYKNPKNYRLVREALILAGREDLIGFDKSCLIRPNGSGRYGNQGRSVKGTGSERSGKSSYSEHSRYTGGKKQGPPKKKKKTIRNTQKKKK